MRCITALVFSVSAVGVLPGCVADHASAIDESDTRAEFVSQLPDKPANPDDPYGSCGDDTAEWSVCSIPGLGCGGWGEIGPCGDGSCEYARFWVTCTHSCEKTSDCPVPITGDAAPTCTRDKCVMPCDENTVCPDGFICANNSEIGSESSPFGWICMEYTVFEPYVLIP